MKRSSLFLVLVFSLVFCSQSVFAAVVWIPAKLANANKGDALLQGGPSGFIGATLAVFGGYWSHSGMVTTTGGTSLRHNTMEIDTIRQNKDACGVPQSLNASDLENGMPGTTGGSIDQALAGQAYWGFNTSTDIVAKPSAGNEAAYRPLLNAVGDKFAWLDMYYRIGSYIDMEPQFNNTNTKVIGKGGHCSGTIWFANLQCGKRMNIAYLPANLVDQCAFTLYDNLYALVLEEVLAAAGCMSGVVDTEGTANKIANQITNGFGLNIYNSTDALWRNMEGQIDSLANAPDHLLMNTQVNLSGNYVGVQTPATSYYDTIEVISLANGYWMDSASGQPIASPVTLYADASYGGASKVIDKNVANLGDIGFNDIVSSVKVTAGLKLTMWNDANYSGETWQYVADNANLGWHDWASSVQIEPYSESGPSVCVYADANYAGNSKCYYASANDGNLGFINDKVSSVKILISGYKVTLYKDANYANTAKTITANTANLGTISFNDTASSVKVYK